MPECHLKHLPEFVVPIERWSSTNSVDSTFMLHSTACPDLFIPVINNNEEFSSAMDFSQFVNSGGAAIITDFDSLSASTPSPPSFPSPSPSNSVSVDVPPWPYHTKPKDVDLNGDNILNSYGPRCKSSQEDPEESFQRDQALIKEYIQSNDKLTEQLAFIKKLRKKKQTDKNLVQDYRFIVSLHKSLKAMKFKNQRVSSKAILACLDVKSSWLSRAKKVVKYLEEFGPDGTFSDPLVAQRLESKVVTHKGSDLLTFLTQRDRARQNLPA